MPRFAISMFRPGRLLAATVALFAFQSVLPAQGTAPLRDEELRAEQAAPWAEPAPEANAAQRQGGTPASSDAVLVTNLQRISNADGGAPAYPLQPAGSAESLVESNGPRISAGNRYVVFESQAPLLPDDSNERSDIYRRDTETGALVRISSTFNLSGRPNGSAAFANNPNSRIGAFGAAISSNGRRVAFFSGLVLTNAHQNFTWGAYRYDAQRRPVRGTPTGTSDTIAAADQVMVYLAELDANGAVFSLRLLTPPNDALPGFSPDSGEVHGLDLDAAGDRVVFSRVNMNLATNQNVVPTPDHQVFLWERGSGGAPDTMNLLTRRSGTNDPFVDYAVGAPFGLGPVRISADGRRVGWTAVNFSNSNFQVTGSSSAQPGVDLHGVDLSPRPLTGISSVVRLTQPNGVPIGVANNGTNFLAAGSGLNGRNEAISFNPADSRLFAFYSNNAGFVTSAADYNAFPSGSPIQSSGLYVKNWETGQLTLVAANFGATSSATWNGGGLGWARDGALTSWARNGSAIGFMANYNVIAHGLSPAASAPALAPGHYLPYSVDWPVVGQPVVRALTQATTPTLTQNISSLELGETGRDAVYVVRDGQTFEGDESLYADVAFYDGDQPQGQRLRRVDLWNPVPPAAGNANAGSFAPAMSANGRFVAYVSFAENLVANDGNGFPDVFLLDRQTAQTTVVSRNIFTGEPGDGPSGGYWFTDDTRFLYPFLNPARRWASISPPYVSGTGRFVVFSSSATNLGASGVQRTAEQLAPALAREPYTQQVYVLDRQANTLTIATDGGTTAFPRVLQFSNTHPSISDDGRWVAFQNFATFSGGFPVWDVVVRDMAKPADDATAYQVLSLQRVSPTTQPEPNAFLDTSSIFPRISGDGRFVVWQSRGSVLLADNDGILEEDIYVFDRTEGSVRLVSGVAGGEFFVNPTAGTLNPVAYDSQYPSMSHNGRYITFVSEAPLTSDDPDTVIGSGAPSPTGDLYIYDINTREVRLVGPTRDLFNARPERTWSRPSDDGSRILVWDGGNHSPTDTNSHVDLYAIIRNFANPSAATDRAGLLTRGLPSGASNDDALPFIDSGRAQMDAPALNNLGTVTAFATRAGNLTANDSNNHRDVFVGDFVLTRNAHWTFY